MLCKISGKSGQIRSSLIERNAVMNDGKHVGAALPWIEVAPGAPYFVTEDGNDWTPIGQNDAISWPELNGLFRQRDLPSVEAHIRWLAVGCAGPIATRIS